MSLETLKIDLAKQLFSIDEKAVLNQIKNILDEKVVVAYSANGDPMTLRTYNMALKKAEQDVESWRLTDSDTLRKEIKGWKK